MSILDSLKQRDTAELPLLYLRDTVVFPRSLASVYAMTNFCTVAVGIACAADKRLVISLLRRMPDEKSPDIDVHDIGVVAHVIQQVTLPDGGIRLLVEGMERVRIRKTLYRKDHLAAQYESIPDKPLSDAEVSALLSVVRKDFEQYAEYVKKIPTEVVQTVMQSNDPHRICDVVGHAMNVKPERKQAILAPPDARSRCEALATALEGEIELLAVQKKITQRVRAKIDRNQKEYFLNEQIREISRELGKDDEFNEVKDLETRIAADSPPAEVLEKARRELSRLSKLQALSPEAGVLRTYCEWIADLPWSARTESNHDIAFARKVLDEDHYGLKKAKERILEFIAVRNLTDRNKGPILCFVGPPGTGKTSLGRSVARALGRSFVRVSLGGVRDEAEIRGHRKTYVGALPGKILQSMKKAGSVDPVFLLDEIDKMSNDFRGDPASALLEVLDPEQNNSFVDHYLEVQYDLSAVMFITTANSVHNIPYPLLDRMELIEIPGYSEFEKLAIARSFIIPRQLAENGLGRSKVKIRDDAVLEIIRHYTMESGVRNLEREIARVIRKTAETAVARGFAVKPDGVAGFSRMITAKSVPALLGKRHREDDLVFKDPRPGVAYGLAWTELGGTLLPVEASVFEGEGDLILTGNLGDVMKESARAAISWIESHAGEFGLKYDDFKRRTIHIHVPEGAIPKDGPSAGITLVACVLSALTGLPLEAGWAMTGEITLTGRMLAIGGVKEKVLAAHRSGMKRVLLPEPNRKDLDDVPAEVRNDLEFNFVDSISGGLALLFSGRLADHSAPQPGRTRRSRTSSLSPRARPSARNFPGGRKPPR
ncbi:MAG: endopeptidase La [Spirochaetes bacterium]|nr:endopeptidase La [Spirochaetota bacterium]